MSDQNSDPRPFDPPVPPTAPPTPPAAPPAPPAPPAPELPPVPQYGEYAPAGYVPPAAAAPAYPVPGYPVPTAGYGQSAPAGYGPGAPAYAPLPRKRRTWDTVLTVILLVLGLIGMGLGLIYAAIFANPDMLSQVMTTQGYGSFTGSAGAAPTILVVSHVVLYLLALGLSIPLLVRGRIVVFWIPLAVGVIAAAIFWFTLISVFLSDPGFVSRYGG